MSNKTVGIGLSGGVDSGLSAMLLIEQGYQVKGYTMQVTDRITEIERAQKVAQQIGIDHEIVDYRELFNSHVIEPWIESYLLGDTPNPCIMCNINIKYGAFAKKILSENDFMATGHYANIQYDSASMRYRLYRGSAHRKDQSYVLYNLDQEVLSRLLLPLGQYPAKSKIRELAAARGLIVAEEKDSDGICFIPKDRYSTYIQNRYPDKNFGGNIVDLEGNILGEHKCYFDYTIGQKKCGNYKCKTGEAVVAIEPSKNRVIVGNEKHIYHQVMRVDHCHFIGISALNEVLTCTVRMFQWGYDLKCKVIGINESQCEVVFDEPVRGIVKGQSAVFYEDNQVIGGGIISSIIPSNVLFKCEQ